jgi:hypothetical protein
MILCDIAPFDGMALCGIPLLCHFQEASVANAAAAANSGSSPSTQAPFIAPGANAINDRAGTNGKQRLNTFYSAHYASTTVFSCLLMRATAKHMAVERRMWFSQYCSALSLAHVSANYTTTASSLTHHCVHAHCFAPYCTAMHQALLLLQQQK